MPACVLKDCRKHSRTSKKSDGLTFHRFLREGHPERDKWIRFVQKNRNENTWLPSDHTCICSLHFKDEDKQITKTGRVFLKKTAIPVVSTGQSNISNISNDTTESTSDAEAEYELRRIRSLKKALAKEVKARKLLASKLKIISRQNKYLKNRCESYKVMVKSFKNRFASLQTGSNLKTEVVNVESEEDGLPTELE